MNEGMGTLVKAVQLEGDEAWRLDKQMSEGVVAMAEGF